MNQEMTRKIDKLVKSESLWELLENGRTMLGCPMCIFDSASVNVLAVTRDVSFHNKIWTIISQRGEIPKGWAANSDIHALSKQAIRAERPVMFRDGCDIQFRKSIGSSGELLGFMDAFLMNHVFTLEEAELFNLIGDMAAVIMRNAGLDYKSLDYAKMLFFSDVIEGKVSDPQAMDWWVHRFGFQFHGDEVLVTVRNEKRDKNVDLESLRIQLGMRINSTWSLLYNDEIKLVRGIWRSHTSAPWPAFVSELTNFLEQNSLIAASSGAFDGIRGLKSANEQAEKALEFGQKLDPGQRFYTYGQYALVHMIERCTQFDGWLSLCHPALRILADYDRKNKDELLKTFCTYIKFNRNISQSADALYIHRNTMNYRRAKIESLLGNIDLSQADVRAHIIMSIKLMEYCKAYGLREYCFFDV